MLDQNVEAAGHDFFELGGLEPNPAHTLAAWSADTKGNEHYTLRIRDIETGTDLADEIVDTVAWAGIAWSADGRDLFYVRADAAERPFEVWRHRLGTSQSDDERVYHEPDERFYVERRRDPKRRVDRHPLRQQAEHGGMAHSRGRRQRRAAGRAPRRPDVEYHVDHWGDRFVVLTNHDAVDFRVMEAPIEAPGDWTELVAHEPGRRITADRTVRRVPRLHEWNDAQPRIRIVDRDR